MQCTNLLQWISNTVRLDKQRRGEVSFTVYGRRMDPPRTFRCFRKLRRVS